METKSPKTSQWRYLRRTHSGTRKQQHSYERSGLTTHVCVANTQLCVYTNALARIVLRTQNSIEIRDEEAKCDDE